MKIKKAIPKRPAIKERDITKAIQKLLTSLGIFHWKQWQGAFSTPGVADIIGIYPGTGKVIQYRCGRMFVIEVKTPKGRVSPAQQRFLENVRDHGGIAFVARSVQDVVEGLGLQDRVIC